MFRKESGGKDGFKCTSNAVFLRLGVRVMLMHSWRIMCNSRFQGVSRDKLMMWNRLLARPNERLLLSNFLAAPRSMFGQDMVMSMCCVFFQEGL